MQSSLPGYLLRMLAGILFLAMTGLIWASSAISQTPSPAFDQQLRSARECMRIRDWDCAVSNYKQIVVSNPQNEGGYIELGAALRNKGNLDESLAALSQAFALMQSRTEPPGPTNRANLAIGLDNLAFAFYNANRFEGAFKAEEMVVRLLPGQASYWNTRGMILEAQGKLEDAIASYRKANDLASKSVDIAHNLSEALQKGGHFDDSIAVLQKALAVSPRAAKLQTSLGNALYSRERFSESEAAYRTSLTLHADDPQTLYGLSLALRSQGKYAEALNAALQAHQFASADSDITLGLATLYAEVGRYDEAASLTQGLAGTSAGDPAYLLLQADFLFNQNRGKDAQLLLNQALAARPDFPEASAALASLQIDLGQIPKGLGIVKDALATHSNNPDLHNSLGLLLAAQSHFPEAQAEFEKTLTLRPNFPDAMINHAAVLAHQNHLAEAIAEYQNALSANPKNLKAQANLAVALLSAKRYDEAAAAFRLAIALSPADPDLRTNLGLALQRAGHYAEARQAFAEAEKLRSASKRPSAKP